MAVLIKITHREMLLWSSFYIAPSAVMQVVIEDL